MKDFNSLNIILLGPIIFLSLATPLYAVSPTPTATPTPKTTVTPTPTKTSSITDTPIASSSEEITSSVVEKIKSVVKNNPSPTIDNPLLGMVGTVKSLTNSSLTFITKNNTLQVVTDTNSIIVNNGKPAKLKDIAVDSKIIVIGSAINSDDIYLAKRIIIVPETPAPTTSRSVIFGTIKKIDATKKTITVTSPDQNDTVLNITSKSSPAIKDFTLNSKIIAIIKTDTKAGSSSLLKAKVL